MLGSSKNALAAHRPLLPPLATAERVTGTPAIQLAA